MEIKTLLTQDKPDGLFISDDLTAILTMKIAKELGISIPDQLKLIGYDGSQFVETYHPDLTTIKQPIKELAQLMVDVLVKQIDGQKTNKEYILPISLLSGGSV